MPHIGPTELIIVLAIILIIFGVGKLPQVLVTDDLRRPVQVSRPGVIAKPLPMLQYLVDIGICERFDVGKMLQKIMVVGDYRVHLGLL